MKLYHYRDGESVIRIATKRKPSLATRPEFGFWIVYEIIDGLWSMPTFPEITWGRLSKLEYLGCIEKEVK